jgi:hypothetical protein
LINFEISQIVDICCSPELATITWPAVEFSEKLRLPMTWNSLDNIQKRYKNLEALKFPELHISIGHDRSLALEDAYRVFVGQLSLIPVIDETLYDFISKNIKYYLEDCEEGLIHDMYNIRFPLNDLSNCELLVRTKQRLDWNGDQETGLLLHARSLVYESCIAQGRM